MKLLLVEDNPQNWDMLSRRLKSRGYEVLIAEDGPSALSKAAQDAPDLILLDMGLPGIGGCDVAKAIREMPNMASIPIIALTAHASQEDRDEAIAAGCNEFETKPVNLDRLLEKITELTGDDKVRKTSDYVGPSGDSNRRHAFLDPLNHIVGFTDLVLEELDHLSKDEIRSDLNKVSTAARNLVDLVKSDAMPGADQVPTRAKDHVDASHVPSSAGAAVLVVDDDINNRALIVRILRKHGYNVTEAIDGDEALEHMRNGSFDLVICDILMPRMDGVELLRHIQTEFGEGTPVIVISALDQMEMVEQCLDLGATDFISKPFEPSILLPKVSAVIRRHKKLVLRKGELI